MRRLLRLTLLATTTSALAAPGVATADDRSHPDTLKPHSPAAPLVIGHRGASGYRPEHTLASYRLAAEQGADFIEPDLVITKDGVLVARHENEIGGTTNVAGHPEFAARKTTKVIDGASLTGWFTEDFTLAELKTLRAKERIPAVRPDNTRFDGQFEVPTFQEVLDLRRTLSKELGRTIGVYPETKHPSYFRSIGKPLEGPLVRTLNRNGLNRRGAPVFVQSFEVGNLKALDRELRVPLVQLLDEATVKPADDKRTYGELATPAGLRSIARYADGVGPWKNYIIPRKADDGTGTPTTFIADAHAAGLVVHPYTFRRENSFVPLELRSSADPAGVGDLDAELRQFIALGVDGFFTDNPDVGVGATLPKPALVARALLPASATAPAPFPGLINTDPVPAAGATQPVGGFSALLDAPGEDTYWAMPDNGFGTKANSRSFLLRAYRVHADFETAEGGSGEVKILDSITLRDPDHRIPFAMVNGATADRLLTGGDFDIESMRIDRHGELWFGDEFGPFLVHADATGKV
ncbi:MAG TPA: glycerophosphodiester phosphodiesterase family protein, partial [Solirubrobacteraceae bacterium]|nr:glycerophosphodiester phosphodiesterase family protein [Solirubrobacteraceae bacterium]